MNISGRIIITLSIFFINYFWNSGNDAIAQCPNGIVNYWTFNADGSSIVDTIGNCDGIIEGPVGTTVPAQVGSAKYFSDSYAHFPNYSDYTWSEDLSVALWCKLDNTTEPVQVMIGYDRDESTHWWMGTTGDPAVPSFYLYDSDRIGGGAKGTETIEDLNWHFLVGTYNLASSSLKLYVDGVLVADSTQVCENGFIVDGELGMGAMYRDEAWQFFYSGDLDEVALFNRTLSQAEINTLYQKGQLNIGYCKEILVEPTIISDPDTSAMVTEDYSYTVEAEGSPDPIFTLLNAPLGMSIDASTGEISWTPGIPGYYEVVVEASNSTGSDTQEFTIDVDEQCLDDIVSYFRFSESSGYETADDASSRVIHLDQDGGANWYSEGRSGAGLIFNGISQYVTIPDHPDFDWTKNQDFTIELWCNLPGNTPELQVLIGRETPGSTHWWIGIEETTKNIAFYLYDEFGIGGGVVGTSPIDDGEWHHIAVTYNGSSNGIILYIDGVATDEVTYEYQADFGSDEDIHIANFFSGGENKFFLFGIIDELAITNRLLSGETIEEHYVRGTNSTGYCDEFNLAPHILSEPGTHTLVNSPYTYTVIAEGIPIPIFEILESPAGMTLDSESGELLWTPNLAGTFDVSIRATNSVGTDIQDFTIEVLEPCIDSLVSYFSFSEGEGSTTNDNANSRSLQIDGNASWEDGIVGSGLSFNGTSHYLSFADHDDFDWLMEDDFTIELWCKLSGNNDNLQVMIGRETSGSTHWWLGIDQASKKAAFYLYDAHGVGGGVLGSRSIEDGEWHHIVVIYMGASGSLTMYVDGVLNNEETYEYTTGFNSEAEIQIANFYSGEAHSFLYSGILDEVAVYNRILTEPEVKEHHLRGLNNFGYCDEFIMGPVILSEPDTLAVIYYPYSYIVKASGVPYPTFTLDKKPDGMTIDEETGHVEWTPTAIGNYNVQITASNPAGQVIQSYILNVSEQCIEDNVCYFRFDEENSIFVFDQVSTRIGQLHNEPLRGEGIVQNAITFNGINQFCSTPDHNDFDWAHGTSFSVELWCKPNAANNSLQVMIGRDEPESTHWWLGTQADTKLPAFYLYDTSRVAEEGLIGITHLNDDKWHHLVAVYNYDEGKVTLYADGIVQATKNRVYNYGFESGADLQIANLYIDGAHKYFFDGSIDEIAFYSRVLDANEIKTHYTYGLEGEDYCVADANISNINLRTPVDNMYKIYPVPANHELNIRLKSSHAGPVYLQLINSVGITVYQSQQQASDLYSIDIENFMSGYYLIRVLTDEGVLLQKGIVKQ